MFVQTVPSICAYFRLNHTYQIPFFFSPESPENIFLGTQQLKSAWGLWPGMPLHAVIFRHLMALPSSLTCSVLTGTHSLLSAKNLQKPSLSSLSCCIGLEVLFYIHSLIPPMWMWLSGNELCYHWEPGFGLKEVAELKHQDAVFFPKTQLCFWLTYSDFLPLWHFLK